MTAKSDQGNEIFFPVFFLHFSSSTSPSSNRHASNSLPNVLNCQLGGPAASSSASSSSADAPPTRGTEAAGALPPFPPPPPPPPSPTPVHASRSTLSCLLTEALASSSEEQEDIEEKLEAEPPAPRRGRAPRGVVPGARGREEVEGGGAESLL